MMTSGGQEDNSFQYLQYKINRLTKERSDLVQKCGDLETKVESHDKKIMYLETCMHDLHKLLPVDIASKINFLTELANRTATNITLQQKESKKQRERLNSLAFEFECLSKNNSRANSRASSPNRSTSTIEDGEIKEDDFKDCRYIRKEKTEDLEERLSHLENVMAEIDTKPLPLKEIVLENMKNIKSVDDRLKDAEKKVDDMETKSMDNDTKPLLLRMEDIENTCSSLQQSVSKIQDRVKDPVPVKKPAKLVSTYCKYESVTVTSDDYNCLASSEFLNDVIIDYYLQYIKNKNSEPFEKAHIFTTYFYKALNTPLILKKSIEKSTGDKSKRMSINQTDDVYERVKNWTKKIDLFEKDFIVVPVNEKSHWYLLIVCFPSKVVVKAEAGDAPRPSILVFDSLPDKDNPRTEACARLRTYLTSEWAAKRGHQAEAKFTESNLPQVNPRVRIQLNSKDCGVFLLQFVESFFANNEVRDWLDRDGSHKELFTREEVNGKRAAIAQTIRDLAMCQAHKRRDVTSFQFPDLNFVPEGTKKHLAGDDVCKEEGGPPSKKMKASNGKL